MQLTRCGKSSYWYTGRFGKSYTLDGLEETNTNMFKRAVVLHAWSGVPNYPIPYEPIESEGCSTVSPDFLETLAGYIDQSYKPIWLYIK
ncbi:MAG: hypothetical protein EOO89_28735 [Pedobacter sp.]|nr:MAG: hypothetical protein EOO89_28735 [Pedobacter sp.]